MNIQDRIQAVIVDDEELARLLIKDYAASIPRLEIIAEFDNGVSLLKEINDLRPHLLFLDIHMPKLHAFELLELMSDPPAIIFTTAYDQYALKAFEHNAVDYLLKPFSKERFTEAVERVSQGQTFPGLSAKSSHTAEKNENAPEILQRIVIRDGEQIHFIPLDSIHYFEAQDDYVLISYADRTVLKQTTMRYFEDHLPPEDFIRIHRSTIVALRQISKLEQLGRDNYLCVLRSGKKFPVSRSGMNNLKRHFNS